MPDKINEVFDFLFIGMGAANCLLLLKMNEKNLLVDKKIAIVEPNSKLINDRNFCFWSSEEELHRLKLHEFIDSKWHKIKVADRVCQTLAPLSYYHIRGLTLYKKVREILPNLNVKQFFENFEDEPVLESNLFILNFKDSIIKCEKVFDSRPPSYESAKKYQSLIFQSFYGWEIKTDAYNFDTETAIMMDFNIPQNYHCQFIYVLPFSKNTALFEVTRFGKEKISKTEAEKLLKDYLQNLGFQYQIYEEEVGVIPMSTLKIFETNYGENWILTRAKANMIKPTTGYAFYNMSVDAIEICDALFINKVHQRKKQKLRFNFYDNLLLKILEKKPQMGKRVFEKLFNKTPIYDVLQFLSEKTTLKNILF
jgi:lycopene beta-cyclase